MPFDKLRDRIFHIYSIPSTSFYVVKQIFPKDFFYFYKTMLLSTDDYFIR